MLKINLLISLFLRIWLCKRKKKAFIGNRPTIIILKRWQCGGEGLGLSKQPNLYHDSWQSKTFLFEFPVKYFELVIYTDKYKYWYFFWSNLELKRRKNQLGAQVKINLSFASTQLPSRPLWMTEKAQFIFLISNFSIAVNLYK